ncbi:MAG: hypothetical protein KGO96_12825 [Elusimicrobia bacterium]|nr:hypothetical protein [Elusimicrobiota bacterium]
MDRLLDSLTREQFDEWLDADELDRTVSGAGERIVWTLAMAAAAIVATNFNAADLHPRELVPGEADKHEGGLGKLDANMRALAARHS